jgi:hypothetical protein
VRIATRVTARGGGDAGADDEPVSVAPQAEPEGASFRSGECGIALTGDGGEFESVVACVLLCGGELCLAGAAVLNEVVEGLDVSGGNFGGGI